MDRVTIKSYPNGLSLFLDNEGTFDELLQEIALKFQKSAGFFKDATLVLSIDGRELSLKEERAIIRAIEDNSKISICSIAGKDKEKEVLFDTKIQSLKKIMEYSRVEIKENKIIWGTILAGESVESDMTIIVLGDIEKNASVTSEKDIIVFGTIYGEVHAGVDKNRNHFIFASSMDPQKVCLGSTDLQIDKKMRKQIKKDSRIIFCKQEEITIQPIKKGIFEDR